MKNKKCISFEEFQKEISQLNLGKPITLKPDSTVGESLELMQKNKFGSIIIEDSNKPIGIVTERDFLRKFEPGPEFLNKKISEIMVSKIVSLNQKLTTFEAIDFMSIKKIRHLPVVDDDGLLVSVLSAKDILKFSYDFFKDELEVMGTVTKINGFVGDILKEEYLRDYDEKSSSFDSNIFFELTKNVICQGVLIVDVDETTEEVLNKMRETGHHVAIVSEYETQMKGIVTERDFLLKIFGKADLKVDKISKFMTPNPHCLLTKMFIVYAFNNMFKFNYRNLIVVNEDHYPVAVLSMNDIITHLNRVIKKVMATNKSAA